jgi:hypothetical protein
MALLDDVAYGVTVAAIGAAAVLLAMTSGRIRAALPWVRWRIDGKDLVAVVGIYSVVVGLFALAFQGFTTDNTLGMFLSFGGDGLCRWPTLRRQAHGRLDDRLLDTCHAESQMRVFKDSTARRVI